MADSHGSAEQSSDMDYAEHEQTYHRFLALAKWATIACVAILIFMAVTLL